MKVMFLDLSASYKIIIQSKLYKSDSLNIVPLLHISRLGFGASSCRYIHLNNALNIIPLPFENLEIAILYTSDSELVMHPFLKMATNAGSTLLAEGLL